MVPKQLGGYKLLDVLGEGGMGIVYRAHDDTLERPAAIKVIRGDALSAEGRERFLREARACSRINHPNIVTVYAAGEEDDRPYMAMEFVEGKTLRDVIDAGPVEWRQACAWIQELLDALVRLHAEGIVHRDLKPENIMVTSDGVIKLMDFGIAHLQSSQTLTQEGQSVGTIPYMSPEQVTGERADARSDIFSLATIFQEMLSGRHPFHGEHPMAAMYAIRSENPKPFTVADPDFPDAIREVLNRAFEKQRDARYADAGAFRDALRAAMPSGAGVAASVPTRLSRTTILGMVGAAVIIVLGFAAWQVAMQRRQTDKRDLAKNLNEMGQALERQGDLDAAEMKYREALGTDPNYAVSYNNLGVLAQRAGRAREADSLFNKATLLDAGYASPLYNLGNLYFDQDPVRAEDYFMRAVAVDSTLASAYNQLGVLMLEAGRVREAHDILRRGLAMEDPNATPYLHKNLGKVAAAEGDSAAARAAWLRAREGLPNDAELQTLLGE